MLKKSKGTSEGFLIKLGRNYEVNPGEISRGTAAEITGRIEAVVLGGIPPRLSKYVVSKRNFCRFFRGVCYAILC